MNQLAVSSQTVKQSGVVSSQLVKQLTVSQSLFYCFTS